YYSRGFYPLFRLLWDTLFTGWFPFALLYVLAVVLFMRGIRAVVHWVKLRGNAKLWSAVAGLLGFAGWTMFSFLLMWGYNYGRIPVEQTLDLQLRAPAPEMLATIVRTEASTLAELRAQVPGSDTLALGPEQFPANMEQQLSQAVEAALTYYNYPIVGKVRGRVLYPRGVFLRFGSAGLYLPWTGEGHIDGGLIDLQRPYTLAHELAHGYGFGDEGTCSFWAYLAAFRAKDPALQYALRLGYWRSLAAGWARSDSEAYLAFRTTLPRGMVADLEAINANIAAYPDILPALRDVAYDSYLKAQGIDEGIQNYGKVVLLVETWREQAQAFFIRSE
ncbi:MAG: hypothetical protein C7N36_17865, partial [Bacteroidetes bacterium]